MTHRDLTGKRFGKLVALEYVPRQGGKRAGWLCECDCGKKKVVLSGNLNRGIAKSCGCGGVGRPRNKDLHRDVLRELKKGSGLTIMELIDKIGYTRNLISSALDAMELEGKVAKETIHNQNKNIWYLMEKSPFYRVILAEKRFLYGAVIAHA